METIYPEHVCNGLNHIEKQFVFSTEEMAGKAKMFARITLPDGSSIGEHPYESFFCFFRIGICYFCTFAT